MWTKNMQPLNNSHSLTQQSESLLYMSSAFANDLVTKNLHRIQVMLLDYLCQPFHLYINIHKQNAMCTVYILWVYSATICCSNCLLVNAPFWRCAYESCSSSSIARLLTAVTRLNIVTSPFHIIRQGCVLASFLTGGFRMRDSVLKWELFSEFYRQFQERLSDWHHCHWFSTIN